MIYQIRKSIILILVFVLSLNIYSFALIIPKYGLEDDIDDTTYQNDIKENIYKYDIDSKGYITHDVLVGDVIEFGRYYYDKDGVTFSPIKWQVVEKKDDTALLITEHIIDTVVYNETWNPISWDESTIRTWLNDYFYNIAFNSNEKSFIIDSKLKNNGNSRYKVKYSDDTFDKVFLLSIQEIREYFANGKNMKEFGTPYAIERGLWVSSTNDTKGYSVWWLRSPGRSTSFAALIHAQGILGESGDGVATKGNGVRPAIWLKLK